MLFTVTFNPALDYVLSLPRLVPGETNRAREETLTAGGKGINVSYILGQLGVPSVALGFLAGDTGELLRRRVEALGVKGDFLSLPSGMTRINVKLNSGEETEINGRGPHIPPQALEALLHKLDALTAGDTLVLSGSASPSLPCDIYGRLLSRLKGRGVRCVVDAAGALLEEALPFEPFLVKPNLRELEELVGESLSPTDRPALVRSVQTLRARGAENVLLSLGGAGALLVTGQGEVMFRAAPRGQVQNPAGAGDALLAGALAGYDRGGWAEALKLGTAAGGATAFSVGLATAEEIQRVYRQLE